MDKNTFGKTVSAETLVEILEINPTYKRKVSALMAEFNNVNNQLVECNLSGKMKKSFLRSTLERFKKKIDNIEVTEVKTFSHDVLKQHYRESLERV